MLISHKAYIIRTVSEAPSTDGEAFKAAVLTAFDVLLHELPDEPDHETTEDTSSDA